MPRLECSSAQVWQHFTHVAVVDGVTACNVFDSLHPLLFAHTLCTPPPHPPAPCPVRSYADSKTLSESDRARLFKALSADSSCVYAADLLSAAAISRQMLGRARVSLNAIAETSTVGLIQRVIDAGVNLTEVRKMGGESIRGESIRGERVGEGAMWRQGCFGAWHTAGDSCGGEPERGGTGVGVGGDRTRVGQGWTRGCSGPLCC